MKAIILDTETNDLPHNGGEAFNIAFFEMRSLDHASYREGVLKLLGEDKKSIDLWDNSYLVDAYDEFFLPHKEFSTQATEKNGYTRSMLLDKPCISTFKFPTDVTYLIGHNIRFDWWILKKPKNVKLICTKELAIKYLTKTSGNGTKGVNTLTGLIERYYPEEAKELIANAHSALQDCKLCYLILLKVLEAAPELDSFEKLAIQCKQPSDEEEKLPFGVSYDEYNKGFVCNFGAKHKGKFYMDILKQDKGYLTWIVEKSTLPQDLKNFVKQFMLDNK